MDRSEVNLKLPEVLCGNITIPCGRRGKGKKCRNEHCGYAISTLGKELLEKKFLLVYSQKG